MSRFNFNQSTFQIYDLADEWKEKCLLENGSMLSKNQNLWTLRNLREPNENMFRDDFVEKRGDFLSKLELQIAPTSPDCKKLIAECIWVLLLFPSNIRSETKRNLLLKVWSWSGENLNKDKRILNDTSLGGIGSAGTAYNTYRWRELILLITSIRNLKENDKQKRAEILWDPWAFSEWFFNVAPHARRRQLGHILSHLLFPDFFERISSENQKHRVLSWFTNTSSDELAKQSVAQIDSALLSLRGRLERERGEEIDFYDPMIASKWKNKKWLLIWSPSERPWSNFVSDRAATMAGDRVNIQWICRSSEPKKGDRVFVYMIDESTSGIVASGIITKFPNKTKLLQDKNIRNQDIIITMDIDFDTIRDPSMDRFLPLDDIKADNIDEESILSFSEICISWSDAREIEKNWNSLPIVTSSSVPYIPSAESERGLPDAASIKPTNLILYGPPGTGKTYTIMSKYLPKYRDSEGSRFEFIALHQNYSYEDFVEGIRPITSQGTVKYRIHSGILRRICNRARMNPNERFALFIDEIDRGNIPKVFGELITLLEIDKRIRTDETGKRLPECIGLELSLPYSGERFGVPINLDVICTMNITDLRSTSTMDNALRRRFQFKELMPQHDLLGSIDCDDGKEIDLKKLLHKMNERIAYLLHRSLTIGHSYFLNVRSFSDLKKVFAREILPLLQESFYDDLQQIRYVLADHSSEEHLQLVRDRWQRVEEIFPDSEQLSFLDSKVFDIIPESDITPASIRKIYEADE